MGNSDPQSVKARLLPLTSTEARLERIVEKLPRRRIESLLVPVNAIDVVDEPKGEYRSLGPDPWFDIALAIPTIRGCWIYLEAALVRNNGSRVANLHVDAPEGEIGAFSWPITTNMRGSVREVVYVPANAVRLRWQPTAASGYFSQSPLLLHAIGVTESALRRWYRISQVLGKSHLPDSLGRRFLFWIKVLLRLQASYRLTAELRSRKARGNDYAAFLDRTENLSRSEERRSRAQFAALRSGPTIVLVVCLDAPVVELLEQAIESVRAQWYVNWQLWVVGNSNGSAAVDAVLERYQRGDHRIRASLSPTVQGLASSFAQALGKATGEFTMRLGQHDVLSCRALGLVAAELNKHPGADVVYSDHDRVDVAGVRFAPEFKPDWNPDLFLSQNYVANLVVYKTQHLLELGGYRPGFEGAEDYDLLLRLLNARPRLQILHIPHVLYSSRQMTSADAQSGILGAWPKSKDAGPAGLRALQEHVASLGAVALAIGETACYRVQYPLPARPPAVSLIIPTRDKSELLRACVTSICEKTDYPDWEILVVDNGSVEADALAYLDEVGHDPRIRVVRYDGPFNYSAINNHAVGLARGDVLGLVNNDVEVISPDWLSELVSHVVRPGVGAVGAKLLYENGTIQHAGVILGIGGVAGHGHRFLDQDSPGYGCRAISIQNLTAVTAACLIVQKKVYLGVGGLNETDLKVAMNDVDFCMRLVEAGYRNVFTPFAKLYHHESMSRGRDDSPAKQQQFTYETTYMKRKWGRKLLADPAYNPNLTLQFEDFTF